MVLSPWSKWIKSRYLLFCCESPFWRFRRRQFSPVLLDTVPTCLVAAALQPRKTCSILTTTSSQTKGARRITTRFWRQLQTKRLRRRRRPQRQRDGALHHLLWLAF